MIRDQLKVEGELSIAINGETIKTVKNLVVQTGKEFLVARAVGTSEGVMSHMALGTGSTAAANGDTDLDTELDRNALTNTTTSGSDIVYTAVFNPGEATGSITEAGIFNASSSGEMLCRTVFAAVNKGVADTMSITWTVTIS